MLVAEEIVAKLEFRNQAPLNVLRLEGEEAISRLFWFELGFDWEGGELPEAIAPGADATLVFERNGERIRDVHGTLERVVVDVEGDASAPAYRARLVPRMFRSRLVRQQRIFMDVSVLDVASDKLGKVGLGDEDVVLNVLSDYPKREFIVQYQEDDVDFISRLVEHAGVAYYFDHQQGRDRIVFVDHNGGFRDDERCRSVALSSNLNEPNRVYRLGRERRMATGLSMVYDYNYRTPEVPLKARHKVETGQGGGLLEYPCHVKTPEEATALAKMRAEEIAAHQNPFFGASSIIHMAAGLRTEFEGAESLPEASLLVTGVKHTLTSDEGAERALVYRNSFTAVDADLPFRPRRTTPRPHISGIVTGIVQGTGAPGDSGRTAIIDEHGRYKIHFHFDQPLGAMNEKASRWVRMAQSFTGSAEGMHFPLKPGVEVAVVFLDGDPDRPIIVGALPNHTQPSVVTNRNAEVNKISTDNGITIQFGRVK
jgi:type VI secretion system secreted protein VgrG